MLSTPDTVLANADPVALTATILTAESAAAAATACVAAARLMTAPANAEHVAEAEVLAVNL